MPMFNLFKSIKPKIISHAEETLSEELIFGEYQVKILREAFRRRLAMSVQLNDEIRVLAARSTRKQEFLQFLEFQKGWIEKRFEKNSQLRMQYPKKRYFSGESFLYLGEPHQLEFIEAQNSFGQISIEQKLLKVEIPQMRARKFNADVSHPELADPLRNFYRHQGRKRIEARTKIFSEKMSLFPKELSFRSQKTRWGSCSASGNLSFNWRLIVAPPEVIDYVIVHELAHLKHHNHSQNFWGLVASVLPDYRNLRKWLRDHQLEADFLAKKSELWL
jgi:predicted metal-dependent hydrolase